LGKGAAATIARVSEGGAMAKEFTCKRDGFVIRGKTE
jgi:hypothetical protein